MEKSIIKTLDCKGLGIGKVLSQVSVWVRGLDRLDWDPRFYSYVSKVNLLNADQMVIGDKFKKYAFHSGYAGGFKRIFASDLIVKNPKLAFKRSLKGILPKSKASKILISKVKIYKANEKPN